MKSRRNVPKEEKILLSMTAVFLLALLILSRNDPVAQKREGIVLTARYAAEQSELAPDGSPLNLNTASAEELEELPGIGETLAERIVDWRETQGGFETVEDLLQVKGIGEKTLEELREDLCVE